MTPSKTEKSKQNKTESFEVKGSELKAKLQELYNRGNINRLIVYREDGTKIVELPVTIGIVGAVLAPLWVIVGVAAALLTKCTIVVEKKH